MNNKKILVTGANGQLGSEINEIHKNYPEYDFIFCNKNDLDISNESQVNNFFTNNKIDIVINCAAYTAVDKAESEYELSNNINNAAVKFLANACKINSSLLIHISTDFVFDGNNNKPYLESDETNALANYATTKVAGELKALAYDKSIVIRTSWVYSVFGKNFVNTILRLAKEKPELKVVNDQIGSPTNAADLAEAILYIIKHYSQQNLKQVYHYSNEGIITWFEFAKEILLIKNIPTPIIPIPTSEFPTPAKRPAYSVLSKEKIKRDFPGIKTYNWKNSLKLYLTHIN